MKTSKLKQLHNQIHGRNDVEKEIPTMGQIIGNDGNIYCPYCDGEENHIMQVYTVIDPTGETL